MKCLYRIKGQTNFISYLELIEHFKNDDKAKSALDIVYKKTEALTTIKDSINNKNNEIKLEKESKRFNSNSLFSSDPNYTDGKALTPQTLIDSGKYSILDQQAVRAMDRNDYKEARREELKMYDMSDEEINQLIENDLDKWEIINDDARILHHALNYTKWWEDSYGEELAKQLKDTKFKPLVNIIADQMHDNGGVLHSIRKSHSPGATLLYGKNLKAKLKHINQDIIGHYDIIVIEEDGTLHVYNFAMNSTGAWKGEKYKKYKHRMALLKLILAYNGYNTNMCSLHLVPINVKYNLDYSAIESVDINFSNQAYVNHFRDFEECETYAKYFIDSNYVIDELEEASLNNVTSILKTMFPDLNITAYGLQLNIDTWIKANYSKTSQNRIRRVDKNTHTYEIYFEDDVNWEHPVCITDDAEPLKNEKLRLAVLEHIQSELNTTNKYVLTWIKDIKTNHLRLSMNFAPKTTNPNINKLSELLRVVLSKYFTYTKDDTDKIPVWKLISNDLLLKANILVFLNYETNQIDVVTLSDFNLSTKISANSNKNIMGYYIDDMASLTGGLIRYEANAGNLEAIRTMVLLNEILPHIEEVSKIKLGNLTIVSTANAGETKINTFETLNKELLKPSLRIVKNNIPSFNPKNNLNKTKYHNPLYDILQTYKLLITTKVLGVRKEDLTTLGIIETIETAPTKEAKRVYLRQLMDIIKNIEPSVETASIDVLTKALDSRVTDLISAYRKLYALCLLAYNYYNGISISLERKLNKFLEYGMIQNRINNHTYQVVVNSFTEAIDTVAATVRKLYAPIHKFTMNFYEKAGYGTFEASVVGNQATAFTNLYKQNESGDLMMEFRNPYEIDTLTPLQEYEKNYLKRVLFEFAKIKSKIYGFEFNFDASQINTSEYRAFIAKNKNWYFKVPLEKAAPATLRSKGIEALTEDWRKSTTELIKNPVLYLKDTVKQSLSSNNSTLNVDNFLLLNLSNPYITTDGYLKENSRREELLAQHPSTYWETNVENLLAHYLEKLVQVEEFNKQLIVTKGVLLSLNLLKSKSGDFIAPLELVEKMIKDFTNINVYEKDLMQPEMRKYMKGVQAVRKVVLKAWLAGNITGMFRDTFEGCWQNMSRALNHFLTDITVDALGKAYAEVTKASFTSIKNITIIDELCKTYRLSNLDVARISEGLTTSSSGVLNVEKWMYSTLRNPDFLNRMVLFVAKCMTDGSWDAFYLEDGELKYDWKKDKRFSVYADPTQKGTQQYLEQKAAYYNAIREYNKEHPEATLKFSDDLPSAYSNADIQRIRAVSNSIYGSYDRSMKAKYEFVELGLVFGMFSTWMNGIVANYFTEPGLYTGTEFELVAETDGSGNVLFVDDMNNVVVQYITQDPETGDYSVSYIYEETSKPYPYAEDTLTPIYEKVPRVICGVLYSMGKLANIMVNDKFKDNWDLFWENDMHRKNMIKFGSDALTSMLMALLFKLAIKPLYTDWKSTSDENTLAENIIIDLLYNSSSRSYDGFMGPLAPIMFFGDNPSPPVYLLPTKLLADTGKVLFGEKTFVESTLENVAFLRIFKNPYKAYLKELRRLEKEAEELAKSMYSNN